MKDEQRVTQMIEGAAFLRSLPDTLDAAARGYLQHLAHGMEKFARLVLDRDEGPTRDVASRNLDLETRLSVREARVQELQAELVALRDKSKATFRENSNLADRVRGLTAALAEAQKPRAAALPTDAIPEKGKTVADNVAITAGVGTSVATDDVSGNHYQRMKLSDGTADSSTHLGVYSEDAASSGGETGIVAMGVRNDTPSSTAGTNGDFTMAQFDSRGGQWVSPLGFPVSVSVDITRPADTTAYAANDALSDSTSAPTSGGFTLTSICRKSGGAVLITDAIITSSNDPATPLQGDIFLFNQSVTNINDNSAFAVSDSEIKTCVAIIPFALQDVGNNDFYHAQNLSILAVASGSANLRFLVRVRNAYTPASGEVITVTIKGLQVD